MFQVNYLNQISPKGTALWTEEYRQSETIEDADALLVRSAAMHDMTFSENLLAVVIGLTSQCPLVRSIWILRFL